MPDGDPQPTHVEASEMFLHAREALASDRADAVEAHLHRCSQCSDQMETLRWIRQHASARGGVLFAEHSSPEKLVAHEAEQLDQAGRAEVEAHLELCIDCGSDLQKLRELSSSLKSDLQPRRVRKRGRLARALPAWAYAAMFVLAIPAGYGMWQLMQDDARLAPPAQMVELVGSEKRGGSERATISLAAGQPIGLAFEIPILSGGAASYAGRLVGEGGSIVWSQPELVSLDEFGSFEVLLPQDLLRTGPYNLIVEERIDGRPPQDFRFAFVVSD